MSLRSPFARRLAYTLLVVVALALVAGCSRRRRTRPAFSTVIDYQLRLDGHHKNVLAADGAALSAALSGVVLSPNLVFEAARSTGPVGPLDQPGGPSLPNARGQLVPTPSHPFGEPVSVALGQRLLKRLVDKGATLIAPAAAPDCGKDCGDRTWVERAIAIPRQDGALPFRAILAVRRLEAGPLPLAVTVRENREEEGPDFYVQERTSYAEYSLCDDFTVAAPGVWFQAELIEAGTGRLLAQFDELRFVKLERGLRNRELDPAGLEVCPLVRYAFSGAVRDNLDAVRAVDALADEVFAATVDTLR